MDSYFRIGKVFTLVLLVTTALSQGTAVGQDKRTDELDQLVTPAEKEFLLSELARIQPPERLRELAGLIAEREGKQAVGEFQQQGPVPFFLYGARSS
ncbi:MAG: hypothetical protein ABIG68_04170 [Acidobacteriota bacterium]